MKKIIGILAVLMMTFTRVYSQQDRRENSSFAQLENQTSASDDSVLRWNQILQQTLRIPGIQPPTIGAQRSYAMMHLAIFDAVNAIDRSFKPYFAPVKASRGASMRAAAAQAAHDVLVALYPQQQTTLTRSWNCLWKASLPAGQDRG